MQPVYLDEILRNAELDLLVEIYTDPTVQYSDDIFYPVNRLLDLGLIRIKHCAVHFMVYECTDKVSV